MREVFDFAISREKLRPGCLALHWRRRTLSRAHRRPRLDSSAHARSRGQSQRAFAFLDQHLFSTAAWNLSPSLLRQLVYAEWVTDLPQPLWAYNPPVRHDKPLAEIAERMQQQTLGSIFSPVLLQRLDDLSLKYSRNSTMTLSDAFSWTQTAVFGDLRGKDVNSMGEIHRSLQQWYARMLAQMLVAPKPGTPYDAQSLARAQLVSLRDEARAARRRPGLDDLTDAHLAALEAVADQALSARMTISQPMSRRIVEGKRESSPERLGDIAGDGADGPRVGCTRPAKPCQYAPARAASTGESPCASSVAMIPVSTSPVPAVASAFVPVGLTCTGPLPS